MKLSEEPVQSMLSQLKEHFGQPVLPLRTYCAAFHTWARAVEEGAEREKALGGRKTSDLQEMSRRIENVRLDIVKSNLLYRLLYLGEKLRTEMCPIHKGHWSGCPGQKDACPHCTVAGNVTGWIDG